MTGSPAHKKQRADELLVSRGLAVDVHEASAFIMANRVRSGSDESLIVDKPGMQLPEDAPLSIKGVKRYVGRGGLKLEGALDQFGIDPTGLRCIDLGASTGGFTDCLLQRGARSVCAVDVGYGQLSHRLQVDPRVQVRDRTNIRTSDPSDLGAPFDLVVADLSFVGIAALAQQIAALPSEEGQCVLLIKPQFESAREDIGCGGVVKDYALHFTALEKAIESLRVAGLETSQVAPSPIRGAAGNVEFFVLCGLRETMPEDQEGMIRAALNQVHHHATIDA